MGGVELGKPISSPSRTPDPGPGSGGWGGCGVGWEGEPCLHGEGTVRNDGTIQRGKDVRAVKAPVSETGLEGDSRSVRRRREEKKRRTQRGSSVFRAMFSPLRTRRPGWPGPRANQSWAGSRW